MEQVVNKNCYQVFYGAEHCPETNCPFARVLDGKKRTHHHAPGPHPHSQADVGRPRVFTDLDESGEIA